MHCNICYSATSFSPFNIFEIILSNTYRSHLLNFTDIQYSVISIFYFVSDGHLSCFQLMANYKSCHSKQTGTYFLSIQIQSRIFELIIRNVSLLPRSQPFQYTAFSYSCFYPLGSYLCLQFMVCFFLREQITSKSLFTQSHDLLTSYYH